MNKIINLKKIKQIWSSIVNDRQNLILFILAVGSVIVATIYMILSNRTPVGTKEQYYENPVQKGQNSSLDWNDVDLDTDGVDPKKIKLSSFKGEILPKREVDEIVDEMINVSVTEKQLEEGLYNWQSGNSLIINYSLDNGDFVVNSTKGIRLEDIERGYIDDTNIQDYFEEFMNEYFDFSDNYNYTSEFKNNFYKVRGTWQLQGYDVVGSDKSPKLISAVFDEGGNLMSLRIKLIKFSRLEDSIDMIDMDVLEEYINLNSYPKSEYIDVASSQDLGCKIYDCYYDYSASDVENISLENTEIVYLLNSDALESVLPVYKFTGKGQVYDEIEEIMVDVDVTVYANAVDPSKLYYNESED